jgi:hypothetical protein
MPTRAPTSEPKGPKVLMWKRCAKLWTQPWYSFWQLPWADRWLLVEAACWLSMARLAILLLPFCRIAPFLGRHMAESPQADRLPGQGAQVRRLGWAVKTMSRHMPWECTCLVQALAGKMLLRRRGFPSTLYLGVAREADMTLAAHAWLRCGSVILTGASGHHQFKVVATFAEESLSSPDGCRASPQ